MTDYQQVTSHAAPPLDSPVINPQYPVLPSQTPLEQMRAITSGHMFGMIDRLNSMLLDLDTA